MLEEEDLALVGHQALAVQDLQAEEQIFETGWAVGPFVMGAGPLEDGEDGEEGEGRGARRSRLHEAACTPRQCFLPAGGSWDSICLGASSA